MTFFKTLSQYLTYSSSGIASKPTFKFTGANVQIVSGAHEEEVNGVGNLVIGADEFPRAQTGSNNIVLGGEEQEFTSFRRDYRRVRKLDPGTLCLSTRRLRK